MSRPRIRSLVGALRLECEPAAAMRAVEDISKYHRIQASQGYRDAAEHMNRSLAESGLAAGVLRYPADLNARCFTQTMFREWNCSSAWLEVTSPWSERVSDYCVEEMSLIQRSAPGDCSDRDLPIIYVESGADPESFDFDLHGKLLFVEERFERWTEAAIRLGAAAILTVSMPEIPPVRVDNHLDARVGRSHANLSFHHYSRRSEESLRGFALSPSVGRKLRDACLRLREEGDCPTARFRIESSFSDGFAENVTAVIGEAQEEILMTAHLCHPRSSVNDNASGAAAAIEAMRILKRMIDKKRIPMPRRSIRLLLMPEFTGTYAYLAQNESSLGHIVAGINLDLVGGRQDGTCGPLIVVDTPDAAHSFSGDLAEAILDELRRECPFGGEFVSLFNAQRQSFVSGSDHGILSDPTIDIPSPAITQWPDKVYHTSADDIAHIDPAMLCRAAVLAAAYCFVCADLSVSDIREILPYTEKRFFDRVARLRRHPDYGDADSAAHRGYLRSCLWQTLDRFGRSLPESGPDSEAEREQLDGLIRREKRYLEGIFDCEAPVSASSGGDRQTACRAIPVRGFRAPLVMRCMLAESDDSVRADYVRLLKDHPGFEPWNDLLMYEVDGRSTVGEIANRVRWQIGIDCSVYAERLFRILERTGHIAWKDGGAPVRISSTEFV